jgi:hypothetical protein
VALIRSHKQTKRGRRGGRRTLERWLLEEVAVDEIDWHFQLLRVGQRNSQCVWISVKPHHIAGTENKGAYPEHPAPASKICNHLPDNIVVLLVHHLQHLCCARTTSTKITPQ